MFRDPKVWETLREYLNHEVIFRQSDADVHGKISNVPSKIFRVWSVGCATGEETYSISHLLSEVFDDEKMKREFGRGVRWSVYGTDISKDSLEKAKNFSVLDAENKIDINRNANKLANKIHFKVHNVIEEPPLKTMSLILCRNVLMFMKKEYQEAVLMKFYDSLRVGGILVLGKAEHIKGDAQELFETVDQKMNIYKKIT